MSDKIYLFIAGVASLIGLTYATYQGYKLSKKLIKTKITEYVMNKVKENLDKDTDNKISFKPISRTKSAVISFNHLGKVHNIYVPYHRNTSTSMLRKNFYLIKDEEKILLEQKPGIPFLISAESMGGDKIIVEDKDGNIISEFHNDEIPVLIN